MGDIKFNEVGKNDLFDLDKFFKVHFVNSFRYGTMGSFYWKMFVNPIDIGFVNAFFNDDKIIATTSITPKYVYFKKNRFIAGEIGDTYVSRKFQGRGFFQKLVNDSREKAVENGVAFIYGTPNSQSLPIYTKNCEFNILENLNVKNYRFDLNIYHFQQVKRINQ
jgi:predicted acetyltransferase